MFGKKKEPTEEEIKKAEAKAAQKLAKESATNYKMFALGELDGGKCQLIGEWFWIDRQMPVYYLVRMSL